MVAVAFKNLSIMIINHRPLHDDQTMARHSFPLKAESSLSRSVCSYSID